MNLFDRLDDLLAIDLEGPGRVRDAPTPAEVFAEMHDLVADARRSAARVVAAERRLAREVERARAEVGDWEQKSAAALAAGRPELARRALLRAEELRGWIEDLEGEFTAARQARETVLDCLAVLEARLDGSARTRRLSV